MEIERKVDKWRGRSAVSQLFHAKGDKETIVASKLNLNRVLHVFNVPSIDSVLLSLTSTFQTELSIGTHTVVLDIHRNMGDRPGRY